MNKKNYIITVNYNGWKDTIECIQSVLQNDYDDFQMIIVDNSSTDSSVKELDHWLKTMTEKSIGYTMYENEDLFYESNDTFESKFCLVQAQANRGFSAGNNIALKYILKKDNDCFVWLLNPDMVIEKNSLSELNDCAQLDKSKIFGTMHKDFNNTSKTVLYGGWKVFPWLGIVRPIMERAQFSEISFISGGSLYTHIDNFKEVGLLPEEYFLYWEEADWCEKAKRSGKLFAVCEKSICYDKGSTSIGSNSSLAEYLYTYNALFYSKRFYKHTWSVTLFLMIKALKRLIRLDKNALVVMNAVIDFYYRNKEYGIEKK